MVTLRRRISRSLVAVLSLSLLNVIVAPVVAPHISAPKAEATTAGIITNGLVLDVNATNSGDMSATTGSYPTLTNSGGGYIDLNGTSHYIVPNAGASVGALNALSVFMWVYPKGAGQLLSQLGTTTINANYHTAIMEYTGTDQIHIGLWNGSDQTSVNLSSTVATPKNNWYLVGLVYDGSKITGYINGVYAGETGAFTYYPPAPAYYGIGALDVTNIAAPASYGNMRFGQLSVYNRALSSNDAVFNFQATTSRFGPTVSNPSSASTYINRYATFSSSACTNTTSGSTTCNYAWQLSTDGGSTWNFISGASSNSYTTPLLTGSYNGYQYRLYAWDPGTGTTTASDLYTITSAATLTVSTPPGSDTDTALSFNGASQYALISNGALMPTAPASPFTLEAWVRPSSAGIADIIFSQGSASNRFYIKRSGGLLIYYRDGFNLSGEQNCGAFPTGEWTHLSLSWNGSNQFVCYLNGVATLATSVASPGTTLNNSAAIGQYTALLGDVSSYFAGQIDEFRIWGSVRSQSEVAADMHGYANISDGNLLGYYDFNEGSGSTLFNRKAGATSATDFSILGSPSWSDIKSVDATTLSAYTIVKFPRSYITSVGGFKIPAGATKVSAIVVAGGGGGGSRAGGGGGAGGYVFGPTLTLTPGNIETVTVGAGGFGAKFSSSIPVAQGLNGQNSKLGNRLSALGGGGGGGAAGGVEGQRGGGDGGSGGGASGSNAGDNLSAVTGVSRQFSTFSMGQGSDGGSARSGDYWPAGGGGGASSAGLAPASTTSKAGSGGNGFLDPIGASGRCLASGGGGGTNVSASVGAGDAGGCTGGSITATAGTAGSVVPSSALANSGSGGGGSGWSGSADVAGGNGGSGIVMVRWITASKPIFTQPTIDTTTAGLIDTITVSANPISPLTRNYLWQSSSDTGTNWANVSTGSGFLSQTYSTPTLETTTSGIRYQYRVVVTDSDTAGLSITDTSTAVYIAINPRIGISGSYTTQKYGATHTDTFTAVSGTGTGNKTFTFTPNNRAGITWNGATVNQATLTLARTLGPGTYYETMTATDTKGATTQYALAIVVGKADTITVTSLARTDTYTGSTLSFTPGYTITGLQNSDTVTSISWSYSGTENSSSSFGPSATKPINAGAYQITPTAIITNSDSYTAVAYETSTLTINRATRTISGSVLPSPLKFGATGALSSTPSAGTADGAVTYISSTTDTCTVSAANLQALKSSGTCSFTARIARGNNYESATSTSVSISLIKADTLTVSVNAITPVTYTSYPAAVSPTVTVSGLQLTNAVGASPVTINYEGQGIVGSTCAQGGPCAVGDTGPGGGKVFYVASAQQSWGRYLEAAPANWSGGADNQASNISKWCEATPSVDSRVFTGLYNGFGYGYINTYDARLNVCTGGAIYKARTYRGGGYTNWYLPNSTELAIMAGSTIRTMIGLVNDATRWGYWGSQEEQDTGYIGSLVTSGWGIGLTVKGETTKNYTRPIRAFSEGEIATVTYPTPPTDAGTYTVKAASLALTSGSLTDYQGVTYTDGSLLINRAQQSPLAIAQYGAIFGTPYKVMIFGGSGTGALTETVTAGTASGCVISGDTVTSTSIGTCQLVATKARDRNYETATATAFVYFLNFVVNQPAPAPSGGSAISLGGATAITLDPNAAPTISSLSTYTANAGSTQIVINGAGFNQADIASITVKFWRNVVASGFTINAGNSQITVTVPAGATTGKVTVTTPNGIAVSELPLTITP